MKDPALRMTAFEALNHSWFSTLYACDNLLMDVSENFKSFD